jgi:hypothetical protein
VRREFWGLGRERTAVILLLLLPLPRGTVQEVPHVRVHQILMARKKKKFKYEWVRTNHHVLFLYIYGKVVGI